MSILTDDGRIVNGLEEYSQYQYSYNKNFEDNMLMITELSQCYTISYIGVDLKTAYVYSQDGIVWKHPNGYEASLWFQHDCTVYFRKNQHCIKS